MILERGFKILLNVLMNLHMGDESFGILFAGCEALLRVIKNNDKLAELDLSGMIDLKSDVRSSGVFELFFEVLHDALFVSRLACFGSSA